MHRVVNCGAVTHIVGPNLHRAVPHLIQLDHIRRIRANRMAIHLNIRDILVPPAALTGNAAHVPATRPLQENENENTNEKNERQYGRSYQDYKPCIVNHSSFNPRDVVNATSCYNGHVAASARLQRRDRRQCDSLSFGGDACVHCHARFTCGNGRMYCHTSALGFVSKH